MEPVATTHSPVELAESGRAIISLRGIEKFFQQGLQRSFVLRRVALDTSFADTLRRKGLEHATRFNWRRAAEATISVYERFAPKSSHTSRLKRRELHPA